VGIASCEFVGLSRLASREPDTLRRWRSYDECNRLIEPSDDAGTQALRVEETFRSAE
jgi:hypothetical protein